MKALAPFEEYFHKAVYADYTPHPGITGLETMHRIWIDATGTAKRLNANCQHCILDLVRSVGRLYYKSKETKVEIDPTPAKAIKKVPVKTTKGKKK